MKAFWGFGLAAMVAVAAPASANDVFGGVYGHALQLFTLDTHEGGEDIEFGYRWNSLFPHSPLRGLQPYLLGSVNTKGGTNFAAAGLSYKLGSEVYLRPGLGIAVQSGPLPAYDSTGRRYDLGSRVVFEPELALGVRVTKRLSAEASFTHLSHAQIFSEQNPGQDNIGLRINLKL